MGYKVDEVGIHSFPSNFRAGSSIVLKNILLTIRDIFIPSVNGVSHAPDEWSHWHDVEAGCNILFDCIIDSAQ